LDVEGEFNIRINSLSMGGVLGHITETFDRAWKKHSVPLNVGIAEGFSSASNQSRNATLQIGPIIKGILRPTRRSSPREAPKDTTIMTSIEEFAGRATIKAVRDKTDWYRRGWEWMVFRRRADRDRLFEPGAFYSAELQGKSLSLSLNDVCDEDEFKTDDGQYLIAYQRRRGSVSRRVSSSVLGLLKGAGVARTAKDLLNDQRLSRPKREMLNSLLKVPRV
jgi:hypothetical protein